MDRLTEKFGDKVILPMIPMEIKSQEDLEKFHQTRRDYENKAIRLAEYEDTGLTPEEIINQRNNLDVAYKVIDADNKTINEYKRREAAGWIPVDEQLPKEYGTYMVAWRPTYMAPEEVMNKTRSATTHFYGMAECDPEDEAVWIGGIDTICPEYKILAWMPLPEPFESLKAVRRSD